MTTTIRIDEEVKERLDRNKRDDETYSEYIERITRTEKDVVEAAGSLSDIMDEGTAEKMREDHDDLSESLESRTER